MKVDCAIIGGGNVGLSVALHLARRQRGLRIVVLEKESHVASHQTGRNSGVIHSGIYYVPGSLKARYARDGNRSMIAFCREYGIAHEVCGKVIVASNPEELPLLEELRQRGLGNELTVMPSSADAVPAQEPEVRVPPRLRVELRVPGRTEHMRGPWASSRALLDTVDGKRLPSLRIYVNS